MELPYDPAVPFLVYAREKEYVCRHETSTQMFLAALLIIAQSGKDPDVHGSVKG